MESNKIFVFPCVSREGNYELEAKIMSEKNITNIIRSITDSTSYVINDDLTNLEFIIDGYYFKLIDYPLTGTQYAYIDTNNGSVGKLLKGDSATGFDGLTITENKPNTGEYLTLCEDGIIPENSKIKFQPKSLGKIDCGELD